MRFLAVYIHGMRLVAEYIHGMRLVAEYIHGIWLWAHMPADTTWGSSGLADAAPIPGEAAAMAPASTRAGTTIL
ncbi:MAG: hypothetical protein LBV34_02300 [Nocardiopsaceae bacterium]|jgi:hypothetical protein|nr:hypothetical protein [Nocardiopsaceae bacterium]